MKTPRLSRRAALGLGVRAAVVAAAAPAFVTRKLLAQAARPSVREFNVRDYGATGDGVALDTAAIQRAVDEAAAAGKGARVILPGGRRYLAGSIFLKGGIEFHLADDAELVASTNRADYSHDTTSGQDLADLSLLNARDGTNLKITGTGTVNGRSQEFMEKMGDEWWVPKAWRPRLVLLTGIKGLEVTGVTLRHSPSWTLHLLGCEDVLVDGIKIDNQLDVPNCDGIDPDHCRNVEIRNCDISGGDDSIVIKTSHRGMNYGPSAHIHVHDCTLVSQSSALKIGTESKQDLHDIRFERCTVKSGCRALCIQLRDEGSVFDVDFSDITFVSRFHADPWWGLGEGISFTAIPRAATTQVGQIHDVRVRNVTGRAENSVRLSGSKETRLRNITFDNVAVTLDRWTKYPGGRWDNRPGTPMPDFERHGTPCAHVRFADNVTLKNFRASWGDNRPDYFTHALEAHDVTGFQYPGFSGEAAHPQRDRAIAVS